MEIEVIERLIALFERSRLTELDLVEGASRLRLVRAGAQAPVVPPDSDRPAPDEAAPRTAPAATAADHIVAAGLFGTFFRAPAPGERPFVAVGDVVQEGQTLAILEAMKMLNPVEADRAGRILRILVADGAAVEAGAPLFVIAPD